MHIWRALLSQDPSQSRYHYPFLSQDEQHRAEKLRTPHPRNQFVSTRGILRLLLSRYAGIPPLDIQFSTLPYGKPILARPSTPNFHFNVSHCKGMAILGISRDYPVGVDVEGIDREVHTQDIAARYFSARESAHLASLPSDEHIHTFFDYWTCKEAYLKMIGKGISGGLSECEITLRTGNLAVEASPKSEPGPPCTLSRIRPGEKYTGAVAVETSPADFSFFSWVDEGTLGF